jgi:uncharacterized membrane protein YdjX (TVP38/TMEM64 family)
VYALTERPRIALGAAVWLLVALLASAAIYWLAARGALSWSSAVAAHATLAEIATSHPVLMIAAYVAVFTAAALLLFPAQLWIIVLGGVLFGFERAFAVSWAAAVLSAGLVFVIARSTIGEIYRRHARGYLDRIGGAFQKDQFLYILMLRFIPICPFCVTNVAPALLGARLTPYLAATAIGVAPYVATYCFAGGRAAAMLDPDHPPDPASFSNDIIVVLSALAAMPVIAVIARRAQRKRAAIAAAPP